MDQKNAKKQYCFYVIIFLPKKIDFACLYPVKFSVFNMMIFSSRSAALQNGMHARNIFGRVAATGTVL